MGPSPNLFLTAVAMRTRKIHMGPLVYLLPLYHPMRLVEEICMLDQLSGGRLEVGVGRGISPYELAHFNVGFLESREIFEESLKVIVRGSARGKDLASRRALQICRRADRARAEAEAEPAVLVRRFDARGSHVRRAASDADRDRRSQRYRQGNRASPIVSCSTNFATAPTISIHTSRSRRSARCGTSSSPTRTSRRRKSRFRRIAFTTTTSSSCGAISAPCRRCSPTICCARAPPTPRSSALRNRCAKRSRPTSRRVAPTTWCCHSRGAV